MADQAKVYSFATITLKNPADADQVLEMIKTGVVTTSSKNAGFVAGKIFKSADGKTIVNYSEWTGGLEQMQANHQRNEQNPDYQRQIQAIEKLATFAPMAYTLVFTTEEQ